MKRVEYSPSIYDLRPAKTPLPRRMPESPFGIHDECEQILRYPLSDIEPRCELARMHRSYMDTFRDRMEKVAQARIEPERIEALRQCAQADQRLLDFKTFHQEYRLHRWNGDPMEHALTRAFRSTLGNRDYRDGHWHVKDILEFHGRWASSTGA